MKTVILHYERACLDGGSRRPCIREMLSYKVAHSEKIRILRDVFCMQHLHRTVRNMINLESNLEAEQFVYGARCRGETWPGGGLPRVSLYLWGSARWVLGVHFSRFVKLRSWQIEIAWRHPYPFSRLTAASQRCYRKGSTEYFMSWNEDNWDGNGSVQCWLWMIGVDLTATQKLGISYWIVFEDI